MSTTYQFADETKNTGKQKTNSSENLAQRLCIDVRKELNSIS